MDESSHILARLRELSARLTEEAGSAIIETDAEGLITSWNPAAEQLLGWPADDVLGKPVSDIIIPERYRATHLARRADFVAGKGGRGYIFREVVVPALHRDGHEELVTLVVTPFETTNGFRFLALLRAWGTYRQPPHIDEVLAGNRRD